MKLGKRFISMALVGAALLGTLAGCGSGGSSTSADNSSASSGKNSEDGVTTIRFGVNGTESEREAYWKDLIAEFEKEHSDIKVELEMNDDFDTKLNTQYAAGNAPDVMYDFLMAQGTRVAKGQYADLTKYVNEWDDWDDFLERPKGLGALGGKQYGIPIFADARIFLYNKDLFKEAGIDPDTPPTTWDELKKYHEKLTKKDASGNVTQVGFSIPTTGGQLANFLSVFAEENGLDNLIDENTDEILFNNDKGVESLEYLYDLYKEGGLTWDSADVTLDPFLKGNAAMTVTTTNAYHTALDSGLNIGVAAPLTKEKQATFCGVHFLYVNSESEKQDAAWEFIKYVENKDNMWNRYERLGFIPLRNSLEKKYVKAEPETGEALFKSVASGTGTPRVSYVSAFLPLVNEAYEKVFLGQSSAKDALDDAASQLQIEIDNK